MEPAFRNGSFVKIDPFAYLAKSPRRLEVVALRSPNNPRRFELKRIIGLPGERVSWHATEIWIDGESLQENYAQTHSAPPGDEIQSLQLRLREYFVAGDNRLHSQDSRLYGPVQEKQITGKVLA